MSTPCRNRVAVKQRIVALARGMGAVDLGTDDRSAEIVDVSYGTPSDEATQTCLYFGGFALLEGATAPAAIARKQTFDDTFAITGRADVFGFQDAEEAERAAELLLSAFEARLVACNRLVHPDDPVLTETPPWDVEKAYVTTSTLASTGAPGDTYEARYEFAVAVTSNIRYP